MNMMMVDNTTLYCANNCDMGNVATVFCSSCSLVTCKRCDQKIHAKWDLRRHQRVDISVISSTEYEKALRNQIITQIEICADSLDAVNDEIETRINEIKEPLDTIEQNIHQQFDLLRQALAKREASLIKEVKSLAVKKINILRRQQALISIVVKNADNAIGFEDTSPFNGKKSNVMKKKKTNAEDAVPTDQLLATLKGLQEKFMRNSEPAESSDVPVHFDELNMLRRLSTYGMLAGPPPPGLLSCEVVESSSKVRIIWEYPYCRRHYQYTVATAAGGEVNAPTYIDPSRVLFLIECAVVRPRRPPDAADTIPRRETSSAHLGFSPGLVSGGASNTSLTNASTSFYHSGNLSPRERERQRVNTQAEETLIIPTDLSYFEIGRISANEAWSTAAMNASMLADMKRMTGSKEAMTLYSTKSVNKTGIVTRRRSIKKDSPIQLDLHFGSEVSDDSKILEPPSPTNPQMALSRPSSTRSRNTDMSVKSARYMEPDDCMYFDFDVQDYIAASLMFRVKAVIITDTDKTEESNAHIDNAVIDLKARCNGLTSEKIIAVFPNSKWTTILKPYRVPDKFIVSRDFIFSAPFDEGGVLYWLGTRGGRQPYANPHSEGMVFAEMSSYGSSASAAYKFVCHTHSSRIGPNFTQSETNAWMGIDLGRNRKLLPNYYCLRHGRSDGSNVLRNWVLQARVSETSGWVTLRRHVEDQGMAARGYSVSFWPIMVSPKKQNDRSKVVTINSPRTVPKTPLKQSTSAMARTRRRLERVESKLLSNSTPKRTQRSDSTSWTETLKKVASAAASAALKPRTSSNHDVNAGIPPTPSRPFPLSQSSSSRSIGAGSGKQLTVPTGRRTVTIAATTTISTEDSEDFKQKLDQSSQLGVNGNGSKYGIFPFTQAKDANRNRSRSSFGEDEGRERVASARKRSITEMIFRHREQASNLAETTLRPTSPDLPITSPTSNSNSNNPGTKPRMYKSEEIPTNVAAEYFLLEDDEFVAFPQFGSTGSLTGPNRGSFTTLNRMSTLSRSGGSMRSLNSDVSGSDKRRSSLSTKGGDTKVNEINSLQESERSLSGVSGSLSGSRRSMSSAYVRLDSSKNKLNSNQKSVSSNIETSSMRRAGVASVSLGSRIKSMSIFRRPSSQSNDSTNVRFDDDVQVYLTDDSHGIQTTGSDEDSSKYRFVRRGSGASSHSTNSAAQSYQTASPVPQSSPSSRSTWRNLLKTLMVSTTRSSRPGSLRLASPVLTSPRMVKEPFSTPSSPIGATTRDSPQTSQTFDLPSSNSVQPDQSISYTPSNFEGRPPRRRSSVASSTTSNSDVSLRISDERRISIPSVTPLVLSVPPGDISPNKLLAQEVMNHLTVSPARSEIAAITISLPGSDEDNESQSSTDSSLPTLPPISTMSNTNTTGLKLLDLTKKNLDSTRLSPPKEAYATLSLVPARRRSLGKPLDTIPEMSVANTISDKSDRASAPIDSSRSHVDDESGGSQSVATMTNVNSTSSPNDSPFNTSRLSVSSTSDKRSSLLTKLFISQDQQSMSSGFGVGDNDENGNAGANKVLKRAMTLGQLRHLQIPTSKQVPPPPPSLPVSPVVPPPPYQIPAHTLVAREALEDGLLEGQSVTTSDEQRNSTNGPTRRVAMRLNLAKLEIPPYRPRRENLVSSIVDEKITKPDSNTEKTTLSVLNIDYTSSPSSSVSLDKKLNQTTETKPSGNFAASSSKLPVNNISNDAPCVSYPSASTLDIETTSNPSDLDSIPEPTFAVNANLPNTIATIALEDRSSPSLQVDQTLKPYRPPPSEIDTIRNGETNTSPETDSASHVIIEPDSHSEGDLSKPKASPRRRSLVDAMRMTSSILNVFTSPRGRAISGSGESSSAGLGSIDTSLPTKVKKRLPNRNSYTSIMSGGSRNNDIRVSKDDKDGGSIASSGIAGGGRLGPSRRGSTLTVLTDEAHEVQEGEDIFQSTTNGESKKEGSQEDAGTSVKEETASRGKIPASDCVGNKSPGPAIDDDETNGYRFFRIVQHKGMLTTSNLCCAGIELYGRLTEELY